MGEEYKLLYGIERLAPGVMERKRGVTNICANVDLYSGLVYSTMRIPPELYTPLFAVARIAGWCAHRVEEMMFGNKIIRPAYKYLGEKREYLSVEERTL